MNIRWMTPFDTYLLWLLITRSVSFLPTMSSVPIFPIIIPMLERNLSCMKKQNERTNSPRRRKSFNLSGETSKRVIKLMIIILGIVERFGTNVKGWSIYWPRITLPNGQHGNNTELQNVVNFGCNKDVQHNLCMFLPSKMLFSSNVCYLDCFRC